MIIHLLRLCGMVFLLSCTVFQAQGDELFSKTVGIIPAPASIIRSSSGGTFTFTSLTPVSLIPEAQDAVNELDRRFSTAAGYTFRRARQVKESGILFSRAQKKDSLGTEGYTISITRHRIIIRANSREGFFYAVQSLLQLLPAGIVGTSLRKDLQWNVPLVEIRDVPKFPYRSFMLDSGRQFQTVEFIKRYLDILAQYKINTFHWHLTEGQGWRIEIKRYPKLTGIGSRVADGPEQHGFYTQTDIKEIVEYARRKCITVVPEIDLPGHSEAALIAYPEFSCRKTPPASVMEYSSHLFCAGNESTYTFLKNILSEVCELFPGQYIHLGGDEAPKDIWDSCTDCRGSIEKNGLKNSHDLQLYFSSRLAQFLKERNKQCILWGDVVEQEGMRLPDNVVIYWWNYRKKQSTAYDAALADGYPVIAGSNYYCYLNFPVTPWSKYKEDRTFDLRTSYEKNPSDIRQPSPLVIGMSAALWTDWNVRMSMIDRRVFPRLLVLAEQMWSRERIPFERYYQNLKTFHYPRLLVQNIKIGPALKDEVPEGYQWD
jgi:N-acetyl-beta-hexosaminidase